MTDMENNQEKCNTELTLAIGSGHSLTAPPRDHLQSEVEKIDFKRKSSEAKQEMVLEQEQNSDRLVHKRKYDTDQDHNNELRSTSSCNRDGQDYVARKKIKYSEEEVGILEKTKNEHRTITATIKRDLAAKLHKTERQIEDWFQNRRARDKLRRVEDDYEYLKWCCLTLTQENNKLKEELQELRSVNPAATSTVCSSPRSTEGRPSLPPPAAPERADSSPLIGDESELDTAKSNLFDESLSDTSE